MKVRWVGETRELASPQLQVAAGDVVDVDDATARSLIEQGLARPAADKSNKED